MSMCVLLVLLMNVVSVQVCSFEPVVLISTQMFWAAHLTRQGCETLGDEPAGQYGEEQHTTLCQREHVISLVALHPCYLGVSIQAHKCEFFAMLICCVPICGVKGI